MELLKITVKKNITYRLNRFPQNIYNGNLKYFTHGEGYKKTVKFEIINTELPALGDDITWYEVCKIYDLWGYEVAREYAGTLTCGIMVNSSLQSYYAFYCKAKDLLLRLDNPSSFFDILKCDYFLSIVGIFSFDIIQLDDYFAKNDKEYDNKNCTYNGNPCSLQEYITLKFSVLHAEIISRLLA